MLQLERGLRQRRRWEKIERRGHPLELALNALVWFGSYFFVRLAHVLVFRLGWIHSPVKTSWEDVLI
jgi:hypothetical protein